VLVTDHDRRDSCLQKPFSRANLET